MATVTFTTATGGDGSTVTDDSNATTGLAAGGHRTRFVPALTQTVNTAQNAVNSATAASASAATATTQATNAATSASTATTQASAAAASAASAAASAAAFAGTSTTSLLIALGSKTFTTQLTEAYTAGVWVTATSAANLANYMFGQVTSYNTGTGVLVVDVQVIGGSGTYADWNVSISSARGATGPTGATGTGITAQAVGFTVTGGTTAKTLTVDDDLTTTQAARRNAANTFTLAQEFATGSAIASAGTVNLDTATGNRAHITGTTTITAFTLTRGPRTLIFDGVLTLTHHATTNNLPGAANIATAAGDRAIYESDGTSVYCVSYIKANGSALIAVPAGAQIYTALNFGGF